MGMSLLYQESQANHATIYTAYNTTYSETALIVSYTRGHILFDMHLSTLLSGGLFRKILNNEPLSLLEFNVLTGMLINNNVPFDTAFVSGTRKNPASLQLTIHVNPSATLVIVVALEPGSPVFSPSP